MDMCRGGGKQMVVYRILPSTKKFEFESSVKQRNKRQKTNEKRRKLYFLKKHLSTYM